MHVWKVALGSTFEDHFRGEWCVAVDGLNGKGTPSTGDGDHRLQQMPPGSTEDDNRLSGNTTATEKLC